MTSEPTTVHLVSLGCARNEVDSEELAGRLAEGGFRLVDDPAAAAAVLVNTCGFIESAKKDSIDQLLAAADLKGVSETRAVIAVGCMAERYGRELAAELPEADAVLSFDDYPDIAARVESILHGQRLEAHVPRDRRELLPLSPVARPSVAATLAIPGHAPASGPRVLRRRLDNSATASLKIASGCDRRCSFCAIPSFRGSYVSRPWPELVTEARWLADRGVTELLLVSENSSSYGKDLGDPRALELLLGNLGDVDGIEWLRVAYLQPAEVRPSLLEAMVGNPKVADYFDLPFQHASASVLRRMRRFGDPDSFLDLIARIRTLSPGAGIRSNFIAGFPGETESDFEVLKSFVIAAGLDVAGVFAYSTEEGTEAAGLPDQLPPELIEERRAELAELAAAVCEGRAADRIGEPVRVLVEGGHVGRWTGRAEQQGPEVDGSVELRSARRGLAVGDFVDGVVVETRGVDLIVSEGSK